MCVHQRSKWGAIKDWKFSLRSSGTSSTSFTIQHILIGHSIKNCLEVEYTETKKKKKADKGHTVMELTFWRKGKQSKNGFRPCRYNKEKIKGKRTRVTGIAVGSIEKNFWRGGLIGDLPELRHKPGEGFISSGGSSTRNLRRYYFLMCTAIWLAWIE